MHYSVAMTSGIFVQLGIPQWLVDTRHAATHTKSLPSIEQLHRAVEFAFQFMQVRSLISHCHVHVTVRFISNAV